MAIFPLQYFDPQRIKIRWGERYVSSALNERFLGIPPGIYRGFDPVVVGDTVELRVDSESNDSIGVAESNSDAGAPGVRVTSTVTLDFTGHTQWPVYVLLETIYSTGSATQARLTTILAEEILATVGGAPATVDLSTVLAPANLPVRASTVSIAVTLNGGTPATITDDGAGNLSGTGLSGVGTINYTTGAMTGITQALQATSDVVLSYQWTDLGKKQIIVCRVDKPAAVLVVDTTVPANRMPPLAYTGGFGFGFMPDGSVEALQAAQITTAEVIQSRTGFLQTFASLDARLDAELAGGGADGMAGRLALRGKMVETKLWNTSLTADERYWNPAVDPGWAGTGSSANVSDDFKDKTRSSGVSVKGVVTDDYEHDAVNLMDRDYREFTDSANRQVYGRLSYNPDVAQAEFTLTDDGLTGITFNKGAKNVTGSGTNFDGTSPPGAVQIVAGDLIQGADNIYYTVDQVNGPTSLDLLENYSTGTGTESATSRKRRRYVLSFYTWDQTRSPGSEEAAHPFASSTEFRYWYQELYDADDRPVYADTVDVRRKGYAGSVADATTTSKGIVEYALTDGSEEATPSLATQNDDIRLGRVKASQRSAQAGTQLIIDGSPSAFARELAFVQDGSITVSVWDNTTVDGRVYVKMSVSGGGAFPGFDTATPSQDSSGGSAGASGLASRGDHIHPLSSAYRPTIRFFTVDVTAPATATWTFGGAPDDTPWFLVWSTMGFTAGTGAMGDDFSIGFAKGSDAADQISTTRYGGSAPDKNIGTGFLHYAEATETLYGITTGGWTPTSITFGKRGGSANSTVKGIVMIVSGV